MRNRYQRRLGTVILGLAPLAYAIGQGVQTGQPARAQQVPLSGRQAQQSGTVAAQQSANPNAGSTVNTSTTTIQVNGSYGGSVPNPNAGRGAIALTLEQAVQLGLRYNLGSVSASASLRQVRGERLAAISALRPSFSMSVSETGSKTDLETVGLSKSTIGTSLPFAFPVTVGPYHYYDARATMNYNVLDFTALHNYRQSKESEAAAAMSERDARELVVLAVGGEYLRVLGTAALVESQEAQVRYAQSSYDQAVAQEHAGTRSPVDTQRSQVELQTAQQRLTSQRADLIKEKRLLSRVIGLPLDADLTLAERLGFTPKPPLPLDEALKQGFAERADLKSEEAQLHAAEEAVKAAHSERLPTVNVNGFLGVEGVNPNKGNGVFSGTASLSVPIWQGGRIGADEQQAQAAVDQRRAEYQDERGAIELDIRNAYLDLQVATDQVRVAESNKQLALQTLKQSQDRFAAGVTDSVEVVQSQESVAAADRDYVNSLYSHNVAKISLARAIGAAESGVATFLKGQ